MQCSFFAIAYLCQFDKVTDLAGTMNFFVLAILSLIVQGIYSSRSILVTCLVIVWAIRLGGYLLRRVIARGKDERFDEMRANCLNFFGFWIFQIFWVFFVSLPVILLNSGDDLSPSDFGGKAQDFIGLFVWICGFCIEWAADDTKDHFYNDKQARSRQGQQQILANGVWKYSRHPNYFGEILCWIGITIIASVCFIEEQKWFYVSLISPFFTFLILMFLSGIPMAEERYDVRFGLQPFYLEYKKKTSPLILVPPFIYQNLSPWIKQVFFFEFPMYSRKLKEQMMAQEQEQQEQEQQEQVFPTTAHYGTLP
jgi:steroid 5-alpha reductase family enzyme